MSPQIQPRDLADDFRFVVGPAATGKAKAEGATLANGRVTLHVDEKTGEIASFRAHGVGAELVDRRGGLGWNAYQYVAGRDPKDPLPNGPVKITVQTNGGSVTSDDDFTVT